jgi:hypothetical protein
VIDSLTVAPGLHISANSGSLGAFNEHFVGSSGAGVDDGHFNGTAAAVATSNAMREMEEACFPQKTKQGSRGE